MKEFVERVAAAAKPSGSGDTDTPDTEKPNGDPADTEVMRIDRRETNWFGRQVVVYRVDTVSS